MKKNLFPILIVTILIITLVMILGEKNLHSNQLLSASIKNIPFPELTPWNSIGGCAAGGSGTKTGAIRWIGEETGGGLLQIRVMPSLSIKKLSRTFTTTPRLSIKPHWNSELGLSIPWKAVSGEVQLQSNVQQQTFYNSGISDLTADIAHTFGMNGEFKIHADITFPTSTYDEKRGTDLSKNILPLNLQMGQGVWSVTPALSWSRDFERSMLILDASLYYPFMVRFDKKNEHLGTDYKTYYNETMNRERFHYKHIVKPYGENDRGDYFPPAINFTSDFVFRGVPGVTQSFQFTFNVPLGVRWIHSYVPTKYDPHPDPDHRAWDALLGYGIEINKFSLPFFFGIGLPIHDRSNKQNSYDDSPLRKWDAPDWGALTEEMIIACGVKTSIF